MGPASTMPPSAVLSLLADGACHSGEELARTLGVTRAAVWKQVAKLESLGLGVCATPGRGYRLERPVELLSRDVIWAHLPRGCARRVSRLDVFSAIDSTNRYLLDEAAPARGMLAACLAEFQHAGRGRRGRRWRVPYGGGLCLSAGWAFAETPPDLPALALAAGVVVRGVLLAMTGLAVALKWPNDLMWQDRKLGGILVELVAEGQGPCRVVVGVGINVSIRPSWLEQVTDWPGGAVDLAAATGAEPPSRNLLAARLIETLVELLAGYGTAGFAAHHGEFVAANYLQGRHVTVDDGQGECVGEVVDVDADGALVVATDAGPRRILSGEVSVRPSA